MNSPFTRETSTRPDVPWWQQGDNRDLAQSLIWPVGMLLLGLIIFFGMVRPALKLMKNPAATPKLTAEALQPLNAMVDEDPERPGLLPKPTNEAATAEQLRLEDARRLARENPGAVANIIKTWVSGEGAAASA
jgi:flagellar M-ring protein FliF